MFRLAPVLAAALLCAVPARAFLVLELGRSQLNATAGAEFTWDSNVFSNETEQSDFYITGRAGLEYERKAALIALTVGAEWAYSHFTNYRDEDTVQPSLKLGFEKKRGRLTGSARLWWRRANEADNEANRRTRFAETGGDLTLKYPVNRRFALTSTTTWEQRDFTDDTLHDRSIFTEGVDVFRVYTSKLDLFTGYRFRAIDVEGAPRSTDHAFTIGASGKLLPRLDGTLRGGWQWRHVDGAGSLPAFTAAFATVWTPRNALAIEFRAIKDFAVTSTAFNTDGLTLSIEGRYTTPRKLALFAGAGWGSTDFFRDTTSTRNDDNVYVRAGAEYPFTTRIKATASVVFIQNWSTFAFADYQRRLFNLGVTARF